MNAEKKADPQEELKRQVTQIEIDDGQTVDGEFELECAREKIEQLKEAIPSLLAKDARLIRLGLWAEQYGIPLLKKAVDWTEWYGNFSEEAKKVLQELPR